MFQRRIVCGICLRYLFAVLVDLISEQDFPNKAYRLNLVRHDLVRHDLVRHDLVRHVLVRHVLVRHVGNKQQSCAFLAYRKYRQEDQCGS